MSNVDAMIEKLVEVETELRELWDAIDPLGRHEAEDADRVMDFLDTAFEEGDDAHGDTVIAMVGSGVLAAAEEALEELRGIAAHEVFCRRDQEATDRAHMPGRI